MNQNDRKSTATMSWTIFARNKKTGEKLVFCQTNDGAIATDVFTKAASQPSLFQFEISNTPYCATRIGVEGTDGRWI